MSFASITANAMQPASLQTHNARPIFRAEIMNASARGMGGAPPIASTNQTDYMLNAIMRDQALGAYDEAARQRGLRAALAPNQTP